jgi:DNA-binding NarL/FixJ family response regulator
MPKLPNIIIVDDHLILREGLISIITVENIGNVIGEASSGKDLLKLLKTLKPDVVIMDIDMPKMNGIDATQKALRMVPDLKIIAYTMFGVDEYYYKMIELGVKGFVLKSGSINQLETAIREVMLGRTYFSSQFQDKIADNTPENPEEIALKKTIKAISDTTK